MAVSNRQYNLYVKMCERIELQPIPQNECTIQLIQAIKLVADAYYGTNIKSTINLNNKPMIRVKIQYPDYHDENNILHDGTQIINTCNDQELLSVLREVYNSKTS